ncbi:MAG: anti-sigma factor, partial [Acidimicrobiia bacterium]|nr:anti-sigma factor [Acidimicrobiia bacterium]
VVVLEDGRGYVTSSSLVPLEAERTYQLWAVMDDGRIISAAVLGSRPGVGTFVVDLEHLTALAITEEIEGGVVTSENDAVVVGEVNA